MKKYENKVAMMIKLRLALTMHTHTILTETNVLYFMTQIHMCICYVNMEL